MKAIFLFLSVTLFLLAAHTGVASEKTENKEKKEKKDNIVNVYAWPDVIPDFIIREFEKETGIKVNFSTYGSNEVLYARLRMSPAPVYDVIEPSSYYLDRMRRENMLEPLDRAKLTGFHNLDPLFLNKVWDPHNRFSVPWIWGVTGMFYDTHTALPAPARWADLWKPAYANQLMLLDDSREVFSMALKSLGYSVNDRNPEHIKKAYEKLRALSANIHLFKSDGVISLLADGEASIGMAWNGDLYRARLTNPALRFVYPADGFVIWVDNLAIPKAAPHKQNALRFIDFLLQAKVAKDSALAHNYPVANLAARKLLPAAIRNDPVQYPPAGILRRGEFQQDIDDQSLALYEKYWEQIKMGE